MLLFLRRPVISVMVFTVSLFMGYVCRAKTFKDLKVRNYLQAGSLNVCRNARIGGNLIVNGTIVGPNGPFASFDVDDGANVVPVAGVVQISGTTGTGFVPSGLETHNGATNDIFIENRRWVTQYVVDPSAQVGAGGTFQTIQAAIDAAVAAGVGAYILVRPGTYTENLIFHANINIDGACDGTDSTSSLVTVIGNHTYADAGSCIVQNISFSASSGDILTINPTMGVVSTFFQKACVSTNTGGRVTVINPIGGFVTYFELACQSYASTQALVVEDAAYVVLDGSYTANTTTTSMITVDGAANVIITNGHLVGQGDIFEILSTTALAQAHNTFASTPSGNFILFTAAGTAIAAHVTLDTTAVSGNLNVTGIGTYKYADVISYVSNGIDPSTIQQPYDWKPYATAGTSSTAVRGTAAFDATQFSLTDGFVTLFSPFFAYTSVSAAGSDYIVLPTDSYLSVDTSSSAGTTTIRLPNTTTVGRTFTIKDRTGSANANNIDVTTVGGTVTIDGLTTSIINTDYGYMQVLFNGTNYEIY